MEHSLGDLLQSSRLKAEASDGLNINTPNNTVDQKVDPNVDTTSTGNTPSSTSVPSLSTNLSSESGGSPAFRTCSVPNSFAPYQAPSQGALSQNWSYLEPSDATESCLLNLGDHQESILTVTPHFTTEDMRSVLSEKFLYQLLTVRPVLSGFSLTRASMLEPAPPTHGQVSCHEQARISLILKPSQYLT
jgi:hypothetical protein